MELYTDPVQSRQYPPAPDSAFAPKTEPTLGKKLQEKVSALGSAFPDSFDYGAYDWWESLMKDRDYRGSLLFKSPLKLVNSHATCRQCHYSFELDAYGRGCTFECVYCYAKEQLTRRGYWNRPIPFPLDLFELRKLFFEVFETSRPSPWRWILERRIPLRIGSMSDSFIGLEKRLRISREILRILRFYKYPHVIFTRSDLIATDEYLRLLDPTLSSVQISIASINDRLNARVEPHAPSAKRRLAALERLSSAGIWVAARINPLFPMHPDGYFTEPGFDRANAPHLDFFSWDMVNALADHKVPSILAGVVRLTAIATKQFSLAVGLDYGRFFRNAIGVNADRRYSDAEIAYYYERLKNLCHNRGISFTTCYIGNGEKDYFQYQSLWDNKADCCGIRGNVGAFERSCQEIPIQIRDRHAPMSARCKPAEPRTEILGTREDGGSDGARA